MKNKQKKGIVLNEQKKSIRTKLVKIVLKDFLLSHLFDQEVEGDWKVELQNKIKETFSFKCEVAGFKFEGEGMIDGEVVVETESGVLKVISFKAIAHGKII